MRNWPPIDERFWPQVEEADDGCWLWHGCLRSDGYGKTSEGGRSILAHRWAYEFVVGKIPEGLELDHLCSTPACVNPAHLEPVTHRENIRRGKSLAAQNARKTHCKHGHEFTPENTVQEKRGRKCRTCRTQWWRDQAAMKRVEREAVGVG